MSWLPLNQATVLIAHDVQRARERLERAISKAWLMPEGHIPQPVTDPNVPLRIQVMPPPGLRIDGRGQAQPSAPTAQCRVRIEVWEEDLPRLWSNGG